MLSIWLLFGSFLGAGPLPPLWTTTLMGRVLGLTEPRLLQASVRALSAGEGVSWTTMGLRWDLGAMMSMLGWVVLDEGGVRSASSLESRLWVLVGVEGVADGLVVGCCEARGFGIVLLD